MIRTHSGRVAALDGVRGIAIVLVLAVHWVQPYFPYFPGGYVGVDVFFVLSGFLITTSLWKPERGASLSEWLRFERRRVQRLYPALVALLVVGSAIVWVTNAPVSGIDAASNAVPAALQLSTFFLGTDAQLRPFSHTWSLSVEWMFYLIWPVVIMLLRRKVSARTASALALTVAVVFYCVSLNATPDWFYFGPVSRSAQILVGSALALFLATGRTRRVPSAVVVLAAAALAIWTMFGAAGPEYLYRAIGYPVATVAAVCLVAGALQADQLAARLLAWTPLSLIGRVSYSLYLWHVIATEALAPDTLPLPRVALGAIGVLGTVLFTAASYLLLERPVLRAPIATRLPELERPRTEPLPQSRRQRIQGAIHRIGSALRGSSAS